jgi:hypothetical protein
MATGRERRGLQRELAHAHGVTVRWLGELRRRAQEQEADPRMGRPRTSEEERARVRGLVSEELERQGRTAGWRPILHALRARGERVSTMLVQQELARLKEAARTRQRATLEPLRQGHEVLAREALWAQDATHLGRDGAGGAFEAEVARDRATTSTVIVSAGRPATGEDLVGLLGAARLERGGLPLVWQSDNGPAYRSEVLACYLTANLVVHLRSRVRTPTDNPAAEHANGELKAESGLGQGRIPGGATEAQRLLEEARARLDHNRPRASRAFATAQELDQRLPRAEALVSRARFYAQARAAIERAVLGIEGERARRKAEQEAIWNVLEMHGLARRVQGTRRTPWRRSADARPATAR